MIWGVEEWDFAFRKNEETTVASERVKFLYGMSGIHGAIYAAKVMPDFNIFVWLNCLIWLNCLTYLLRCLRNYFCYSGPVHMTPAWKSLGNGTKWKRNASQYETKAEPFLSSCGHPLPAGFDDGTTPRLITQWNKARTIWYHHLLTKEDVVNRNCFMQASCEHFSIRNKIMPVPGQWCHCQIIPASCECQRGLSLILVIIKGWGVQGVP